MAGRLRAITGTTGTTVTTEVDRGGRFTSSYGRNPGERARLYPARSIAPIAEQSRTRRGSVKAAGHTSCASHVRRGHTGTS